MSIRSRLARRRAARIAHLVEGPKLLTLAADIVPDLVLVGTRLAHLEDRGGTVEVWHIAGGPGGPYGDRFLVTRPGPLGRSDLLAAEHTVAEALRAGLLHVYL